MNNPFIGKFETFGWLRAGDLWAKLALLCADRARACWLKAGMTLDDAETAFRKLAERIEKERGTEPADAEVWDAIAEQLEKGSAA